MFPWFRRPPKDKKKQPQEEKVRVREPITVEDTVTATEQVTEQVQERVTIPDQQTDLIGLPNPNENLVTQQQAQYDALLAVSYTHLRAHETLR